MKEIQTLLRQLGIYGTYKGYHYLLTTIEMALEDEKNLTLYSKMIFPAIARKYQSAPSCVERDISTVIDHCWNSSGREKLQSIVPCPMEKKPTVGQFIYILYYYIKNIENQADILVWIHTKLSVKHIKGDANRIPQKSSYHLLLHFMYESFLHISLFA